MRIRIGVSYKKFKNRCKKLTLFSICFSYARLHTAAGIKALKRKMNLQG